MVRMSRKKSTENKLDRLEFTRNMKHASSQMFFLVITIKIIMLLTSEANTHIHTHCRVHENENYSSVCHLWRKLFTKVSLFNGNRENHNRKDVDDDSDASYSTIIIKFYSTLSYFENESKDYRMNIT